MTDSSSADAVFHVEKLHVEQTPERKKPRRRAGTCCVCKERDRRPGQATCRECHSASMSEYRRNRAEEMADLRRRVEALEKIVMEGRQ